MTMEETPTMKENGFAHFFHIRERGSKPLNEILGGAVTFLAMCYILPVNANILSQMGMNTMGVFASTAIVSAIVTLIMALVANCPIALSSGMGLNAYLVFTVSMGLGYSWQECMILLTLTGIIFFIFSLDPNPPQNHRGFPRGSPMHHLRWLRRLHRFRRIKRRGHHRF
jgi:xanthine/uracil/vitamin C permease (AzgA family)